MRVLGLAILLMTLPAGATRVLAGPHTDALGKCLVDSTTTEDRTALVRWMFSAAASHPAVQDIVSISKEQTDGANRNMAELIMRLVTESCRTEAADAFRYDGAATFEASFNVLGQVAGREMFTSPEVGAALAGLQEHIDEKTLEEALEIEAQGSTE